MMQEFSRSKHRFGSEAAGTLSNHAPKIIAVVGGKSQVGTSMVAANTAIALAQWGQRVVLVDAHLQKPDLTQWYAADSDKSLLDLAQGSRDIHEVLQRGPAGVQFLPGAKYPAELNEQERRRIKDQLHSLGRHVETVVVDLGWGPNELITAWANALLVVSSVEQRSILGSYAVLKTLETSLWQAAVINMVGGNFEAEPISQRLRYCSEHFLDRELNEAGCIPTDSQVSQAKALGTPLLLFDTQCPAAQGIQQLAGLLAASRFRPSAYAETR